MTATVENDARTYLPPTKHDPALATFVESHLAPGRTRIGPPALVAPDGTSFELTEGMYDALTHVVRALAAGLGVTVAPRDARLTTQQAADFLGMSRPTLVRLLEAGTIPMTKPARHRYVQLHDLIGYEERLQSQRRTSLAAMTREAEEARLHDVTDGPPPAMR